MDRDSYRADAEEFAAALGRESYRHFAGLSDRRAISQLYERFGALFERAAVEAWRQAVTREPDACAPREMLRFCVEGHLARLTQPLDSELSRRESALRIEVGGQPVGLRESLSLQANEPDADVRAAIERLRLDVQEGQLNALRREALEAVHQRSKDLGWPDHRTLCEQLMGVDLVNLSAQSSAFSAATDTHYAATVEPQLRRTLGIGLADMRRSDLPRFLRDVDADVHFPEAGLLAALRGTLRDLGLEIHAQGRIRTDLEARVGKSSRAFCAAARVPQEIYLVLAPSGGREDFASLLHECGHAQHFAGIDSRLGFEARRLGDRAVGEAYAFLFDGLIQDPAWLERRLGCADNAQLVAHGRAQRLMYLRRYAAKLEYEQELHSHAPGLALEELAQVYRDRLTAAVGVPWPRETWLSDVDPGLYAANYLRAWTLEAHLRRLLRERFGSLWFEQPAAGAFLTALWREGGLRDADELLADLTGAALDPAVLLADLDLAGEPIES